MTADVRKRELKRAYRANEQAAARTSLGLSEDQLKALLAELEESIWGLGMPCDHTLGRTEAWATREGLDVARALEGVRAHGGFCDCEVAHNVRPYVFGWGDD